VHHSYTLLANVACINFFCAHSTRLLQFLNFNAIMFASVNHVFDKAWTTLIYHDSMIAYYRYHDCQPQSQ